MVSERSRRVALFLGLLLGLMALFAGCSGDENPEDPDLILKQAAAAMKDAKSFHVVYDVERPPDAKPLPGLDVVGITGDVAGEGEMKATIDLLRGGVPLQLEFVASGPLHYIENPTSGDWQAVPAALSPVGAIDLGAGAIGILERVTDATYEGREKVDGVETHHLAGTVQGKDIAQIVAALSAQGSFPGEVWIGVDDDLVRRIQINGTVITGEDAKTVRTVDLSKFNEPVTIEPPITRTTPSPPGTGSSTPTT